MEYIINYLLESSLILGVLTVFYRLVLHYEPLFKFNRFYLLFSLLLSAVVPFIHISLKESSSAGESTIFVNVLETVNVFAGDVRETVIPVISKSKPFKWLYAVGAIGLLFRLVWGIVRLGGLSKKATWQKVNGVRIADLPGQFNPFSFFHVIFINRSLYSNKDLEKIMVHEMAHVKYRHSFDVLMFEFLLIVQWFNPFAWLVKYLLKELHEFQADRSVLKNGTSVGAYKELLLFQATGARLLPVNNFNQSITKKRFKMMTNNTLKNKAFVKTLLSALMIVSVGVFFACDNEEMITGESTEEILELKSGITNNKFVLGDSSTVFFIVEEMPKFPGGDEELREYIARKVKYPEYAQENGIQGTVYAQFVIDEEGNVANAKVVRGIHSTLDEEAIRVVESMPQWTPGKQRGKLVKVSFTLPVNFSLQKRSNGKDGGVIVTDELKQNGTPLIYLGDKKITMEEMSKIKRETIESVNVLKEESAIKQYGEEGKDGVILIKLK